MSLKTQSTETLESKLVTLERMHHAERSPKTLKVICNLTSQILDELVNRDLESKT